MSTQIVVFPRGQLTARDKERLTKAGVVAVEADTPHQVQCLTPMPSIPPVVDPNDILLAAMLAVDTNPDVSSRGAFTAELTKLIRARHGK